MMIPESVDQIMAETLWHIDAEAEDRGWDRSAELYVVRVHPLPPEAHMELGVIELQPIPGWQMCLDHAPNPEEALIVLCALLSEAPWELIHDIYPPGSVYGAVIVTEALAGPAEFRFTYCVSLTGWMSALNHERDGIAQAYDGHTEAGFDMRLPRLLTHLLGELTQ